MTTIDSCRVVVAAASQDFGGNNDHGGNMLGMCALKDVDWRPANFWQLPRRVNAIIVTTVITVAFTS